MQMTLQWLEIESLKFCINPDDAFAGGDTRCTTGKAIFVKKISHFAAIRTPKNA
jgi:hypothetical protein